jgi:uncharacterized circularly permuted ATP-grasp superfamily protein
VTLADHRTRVAGWTSVPAEGATWDEPLVVDSSPGGGSKDWWVVEGPATPAAPSVPVVICPPADGAPG